MKYESASEIKEWKVNRMRVRTINLWDLISTAVRKANLGDTGLGYDVENGGSVPNCYNYPARSECGAAVAVRTHGRGGRALVRFATKSANKISYSGTAAATLGNKARAIWDNRMTSETAAREYLRRLAWDDGDIRWEETHIGGLFFKVDGYKWMSAGKKIVPVKALSVKPAMRAMRRIAPRGWSVVLTPASHGAKPTPAYKEISTGEEYHVTVDKSSRCEVIGSRAAAAAAFETRFRVAHEKSLQALIDSGAADDVYVCAADSYRAGNCKQGTATFAVNHALDITRHYTAGQLREIANGDAKFVRAALIAGIRRDRTERERGFALLADHQTI